MKDKSNYNNQLIGITFSKPSSWYFVSKKHIQYNRRKQILAEESKNGMEDFDMSKDELLKILGDPLCVMTKYDQNDVSSRGTFSPTITVQATLKETVLGLWGNKTFEDVINSSRSNISDLLEDFKMVKEYGQSNIDGKKAYEFECSYTFKHEDLHKPITVRMNSIKIETDKFFIDINCHGSLQVNEPCEEELRTFINSLKLR